MQYFTQGTNAVIQNSYRELSRDEEIHMVRLAKLGSIEARNALLNGSIKLIAQMCNKYCNAENTADDLFGEACLKIDTAVSKYEVGNKSRFTTYFMFWVRDAITGTIYDNGCVRYPRNVSKAGETASIITIDKEKENDKGERMDSISNLLADPTDMFDCLVESEKLQNLATCKSKLSKTEQVVIDLFYNDSQYTLADVASYTSLTVDIIRNIKAKALKKLHTSITQMEGIA